MSNTWGSQTWSFNQWNDLSNVSFSVTGIPVSSNLGDETTAGEINSGWGRQEWGAQGWGIQGTLEATGNSLSSNLGSVTTTEEINIGWGSDTWGSETWGISGLNVDLTGIQLSLNTGTLSATGDASLDVTGEEATATEGNVEGFSSFVAEVTGQAMTMDLTFDPEIVSPTGQELTTSLCTATLDANTIVELTTEVTPGWGASVGWSQQEWGQASVQMSMSMDEGTVDPSPDATVTGIGFSGSLAVGTVVIGEANVTVVGEGFAAGLGLGTLDAVTFANVTGISMSANLGSIAEVTGTAVVNLTGFDLTMELGTNTNTLIWNQVDTGTAPVDPPGWVEVAA